MSLRMDINPVFQDMAADAIEGRLSLRRKRDSMVEPILI